MRGNELAQISTNERLDLSQLANLWPMTSAPLSLTEHSQTIATRQPSLRSASNLSASRLTVSLNFDFQNFLLEPGVVQNTQFSCLCQKHPWTWIAARYFGKTTSGRPGSPDT